jgi:uncharacterized protein
MTDSSPLRIPVADLLKRFGAQRTVQRSGVLGDLATATAQIQDRGVDIDLLLERVNEGIVARGRIAATWTAPCSRCLAPTDESLVLQVDELFEADPVEGETYRLDGESLDLEPMVRDALVLELPAAPLCRHDCAGLCAGCGVDRNVTACVCVADDSDPRWAALRSLEL